MDKIPFEDGVKLKNATVTVNEQEYEVTPAQYSGTTPISAFNLNKMQDNIENAKAERTDVESLSSKVSTLENDTNDSGWQTASLTTDFKPYQDNSLYTPRYRKIGKIININGVVKPSRTIEATSSAVTIFTLPQGYRPSMITYAVCQGSVNNKWLLTIAENGNVGFSRYGVEQNVEVTEATWLPFNITYMVD